MAKVSVIMPNFNKAAFIVSGIRSVLDQTHKDLELIVVDDHSTDNSVEIVGGISDPRIVLLMNERNRGANYCRNLGISSSRGSYILFVDADDLLAPFCIERRLSKVREFSHCTLLVFSMGVFRQQIGDMTSLWKPVSSHPLRDFLSHDLPWSIMQPLWKRDFLLSMGGFDESFERLQDVELHTRALLDPRMQYRLFPGEPDCFYRVAAARRAFEPVLFLSKWIAGASHYCRKFRPLVKATDARFLAGTMFQTLVSLAAHYKAGEIGEDDYRVLEAKILADAEVTRLGGFKRTLMTLGGKYNRAGFRVPGLNRLIKKLLVS